MTICSEILQMQYDGWAAIEEEEDEVTDQQIGIPGKAPKIQV